ncbi:MAG TPA: ChaN family lipoprotein [Bacteroidales bacterium]|nr:ChaN family lipoprotein [Bacteroidales bacterium]
MKSINLLIGIIALIALGFKTDKPAYLIFDSEGKKSSYTKMMKELVKADVIFIGELHNDPIAHWLEYEITSDLYQLRGDSLILGAEMFERDNQLMIDEYLNDYYTADKFEAEVKLWGNYKTDYKPLVEFARTNNLKFIATNIPRRYASMVSRHGFEILDSLTDMAKSYFAPLPFEYDPELPGYKNMLSMASGMPAHMSENLPKAQAAKDATMGYSIAGNMSEGDLFIHYNGSYHSSNFEGILWYLNRYRPGLNVVTIEIVNQPDISEVEEENLGKATFIICVPGSMTKTY